MVILILINKLRSYLHLYSKNIPLLITLLILISTSCTYKNEQESTKFDCKSIIGKWTFKDYKNGFLQITNDSLFAYVRMNNSWRKVLNEKYDCKKLYDTVYINTNNSYNAMFINYQSCIVWCTFKSWEDSNRVDEVNIIENESSPNNNSLNHKQLGLKDIIILPDRFYGVFAIAFSQENGKKEEYDSDSNRVFRFNDTSNLLLKTQAKEDIFNIVTSNIKVYYQKNQNDLIEIPLIDKSILLNGKSFTNDTMIYVVNMGFNQVGRKSINHLLKKNISGNIAFFKIGKSPSTINRYDTLKFRN